jgi:hypothetical protein
MITAGVVMGPVIADLKRFPRVQLFPRFGHGLKIPKPQRQIKPSMELPT